MDVEIASPRGALPAYVALPEGETRAPGVVVIHAVFGMNPELRSQAGCLAGEGFLAAAPNLLHWGGWLHCVRTIMREIASCEGRSFDDVEATRAWLASHARSTGKVGVIGFCMGGGFAMALAPKRGFDASAPNYGFVPKNADEFFAGSCPVVASFGKKDLMVRGAATKLASALEKNGVVHDVKEYPDAGHSFLNDHKLAGVNVVLRGISSLLGNGYHEASAADARARIVTFFRQHLG